MGRNPRQVEIAAAVILCLVLGGFHPLGWAQSPGEFKQRREALIKELKKGVAIFQANPRVRRNGDVHYEFRQESNFYYLTGFQQPDAYLMLFSHPVFIREQKKFTREILFAKPPLPLGRISRYIGKQPTLEEIQQQFGLEIVLPLDQMEEYLSRALSRFEAVYYPVSKVKLDEPLTRELELIRRARERLYEFSVKDPRPILTKMRLIKSPAELEKIEKAVEITCQAHREAMRSLEPDMYEYELEAVVEYVFRRNGAERLAFPSIVGSGPNSVILHYSRNNRQMKAGEVVVVDIGAEYGMYAADVTRTLPVSGRFTPEQREIYEIVLRAQRAAIEAVKPGVNLQELDRIAREVIDKAGFGKFFAHPVGHFLGLDVHDVGAFTTPFQPGMVISVEPGIYIPEGVEEVDSTYWNIGVRIEDNVLVTEDGHRILSTTAPREIEEIEALMREQGIGNTPLR